MKRMEENRSNSYLFAGNADFMEELYERYLENPASIDEKWKKYFDSLSGAGKDVSHNQLKEKFINLTQNSKNIKTVISQNGNGISEAQIKVWELIDAYRLIGVDYASLDPLQRYKAQRVKELDINELGLANELNTEFFISSDVNNAQKFLLKDIIGAFEKIYCGTVGFEFKQITDYKEQKWLSDYVENNYINYKLANSEKIKVLEKLTEAEGLEKFLHTKYVGQKRFSLEGAEAFIPAIDRIITTSANNGVKEVFIGMAHRGRINALVNIMGWAPQKLFDELAGNYPKTNFLTSGDVKYHKGYKCNYVTDNGLVKTIMAFNPSHLEVVNPVVNGMVRATVDNKQDELAVLGVLVHGDAALSGLGTNLGTFSMSQTRGYGVGGMIHIVINNQVGFTTSDLRDSRSSRFCTDVIKMIEAPVIHVNADDLESVIFVMDLAVKYRMTFKKDIMIDLVCYRKYGHNEFDDPTLTQPLMYSKIKQHVGTRKIFADKLISEQIITQGDVDKMLNEYRDNLDKGLHIRAKYMQPLEWYDFDVKAILQAKAFDLIPTKINLKDINLITEAITKLPNPKFKVHPTVARLIESRKAMGSGEQPIDFGMAEMLAYGSLLQSGVSVRLTGEDTGRGTFSHRHAVWHDSSRDDISDLGYIPLSNLCNKSHCYIYDSILNEECVLGFEYGYGNINLRNLVIWEAQYGDFANSAQVVIDQYISAGEAKWGVLSNITMLLPHGFDGDGPEHSSARLERFLQLCAENNMQVVIPSNASQMFHVLRRQALSKWIKPLIIFMSKKLLRYKEAMSEIKAFTDGEFKLVIADTTNNNYIGVDRVIVCSGQIYYDLRNECINKKLDKKVAIIRIEQLYPFPDKLLKAELSKYNNVKKFIWVQEEPYNQGSWLQIREVLDDCLLNGKHFNVVTRKASSAPSCGSKEMHNIQSKQILVEAFS